MYLLRSFADFYLFAIFRSLTMPILKEQLSSKTSDTHNKNKRKEKGKSNMKKKKRTTVKIME
jgi:hypothetical protein